MEMQTQAQTQVNSTHGSDKRISGVFISKTQYYTVEIPHYKYKSCIQTLFKSKYV